jgi:hypothetical protein
LSSRLLSGVLIVLFLLIVNIVVAFIESGVASSSSFSSCDSEGTYEDCDNVGKTSFFSALADVSFTGFTGAPDIVNAIWLTMMGLLLSTAILLIVVSFIPTTSA